MTDPFTDIKTANLPAESTPILEKYGRNLTQAAQNGWLTEVVGRDEEIQMVVETLCRRTKRNPVLVGPAGVGKTAIVEGLAQRISAGQVPGVLAGSKVFALQPSTLVAGAGVIGELEKRMLAIIHEAYQPNILLFIDEIHSIIGAGGMPGSSDIASILKPVLARGEISCIAATTDDEYRRYIESDSALERRFQPLRINALTSEQTLGVLKSLRSEMQQRSAISISDSVLAWLVDFGQQNMRNRHFPDKAVDLLEQCYAHCIANNRDQITLADAQTVAQRMIGMPVSIEHRLNQLRAELVDPGLLTEDETILLINRLAVTMRGLDLRSLKPNAVLLLNGEAAENAERLGETIARCLFGSPERVIAIDLSRMVRPEDISLLTGSPPGFVGYSDTLPLHRLAQIPWCVVRFENIDACFPAIRDYLAQAFENGKITDGRGKPIYFSDAVILLTANIQFGDQRPVGFLADQPAIDGSYLYRALVESLGSALTEHIDLMLAGFSRPDPAAGEWLRDHYLKDLSLRYEKQGVNITWDGSLYQWLSDQNAPLWSMRVWEDWVDNRLSTQIIPFLKGSGMPGERNRQVRVQVRENTLEVLPVE